MKIRAVKNGCLFLSTGDALIVRQGDELELSSSGAGLVESGLFEFIGGSDQAGYPPYPAGQTELAITGPKERALSKRGRLIWD
jgi:hypothetical protein